MANFLTDGSTITQSALSRTLCGMLSGAFRISFITVPAFSTRSCSLSCAKAGRTSRVKLTPSSVFFIMDPQMLSVRPKANSRDWPRQKGRNKRFGIIPLQRLKFHKGNWEQRLTQILGEFTSPTRSEFVLRGGRLNERL